MTEKQQEPEWPYLSTENTSQKNPTEDDIWKNMTFSEPKKEVVLHTKSPKQKYVRKFQKRK